MQESDEKYKASNPFVYSQLQFITSVWDSSNLDNDIDRAMRSQMHATADYLRNVADNGTNYAIITLNTFLPVDSGTAPITGRKFLGNGADRQFGHNDLNSKTLQYGVVNLDYNSVVGFNYDTITEEVDASGNVIKSKRDGIEGMYWNEYNLDSDGGSDFTSIGATTSQRNELVYGSPPLDYTTNVQIRNKSEVSFTVTLDKFPSYEGYISINGGSFNTLYQYSAIPAPINPFFNLAVSRGTFTGSFTYEK
ncbi:DUF3238 domain-containing protein [Paenibacillus sp. WST5]|uniref:DUF3238 domain-containing protein n=2 Tax=Paenibacillus sedimenti TaxID=2770274 RepID=A0A926KLN6_9BACL|nr:DUF3238 domain-containing protein [Paenibacillus sedimenti]